MSELFIYDSDFPAKHFPRLLYQTRYRQICFVCFPAAFRERADTVSERKFKTGPIVSQHLPVGKTRARPCLSSKDVWRNGHCVSAWMACISCRPSPNRRHAEPHPAVLPQGSFTQTYVALRRSLSKISFVPRVKSSRAHRPTATDSLKGSTGPLPVGKGLNSIKLEMPAYQRLPRSPRSPRSPPRPPP